MTKTKNDENDMLKTFIIILLLVAGSMVLLSVGVLLRKDHTFRSEHISENKLMRERGIHCATSQDREARRKMKNNKNLEL